MRMMSSNVEQNVGNTVSIFVNKERRAGLGSNKVDVVDLGGKALIPSPRSLLETVQRFLQKTERRGRRCPTTVSRTPSPPGGHEGMCSSYPASESAKSKAAMLRSPNRRRFDNWIEGPVVVHVNLLEEPLHHPMGLVPC